MSDPTTQTNYNKISTEHINFDWTIDFDTRTIGGTATHTLIVREDNVNEVIFDTNSLNIKDAFVNEILTEFDLKPKHEIMGSALHIPLPSGLSAGSKVEVRVEYRTSPESTALQWLEKEQTQGRQFPYLFSQCQPIYARALAPVQDTSSVKVTYSASVKSILPVLLSAIRVSPPANGPPHDGKTIGQDVVVYTYNQPVPIPSYLLAIAAGSIHYRPFQIPEGKSWTSGIWTEPELMDKAHWEFCEDTTRFLAKEESIVTPYHFGVYDLLVLPPSFPFGGMENACCTFLTPTLLSGDRTLVDVVVHELTHSWFGNGVTQANSSHFWLNEGWTTYMERVLQQFLHSPAERGFSYIIGERALKEALEEYQDRPKYQRLVIDFEKGEDVDDAYSSIPYEKGANFLLHIERILGGLDVFLPYVKDYVSTFIGKSITTEDWKKHLYEYFSKQGGQEKVKALDSIDWNAWLYGEGLELPVKMEYDTTLATQAYELASLWDSARSVTDISKLDFKKTDLENFNGNQIIVFLEKLQSYPPLPSELVIHLGSVYELAQVSNAEIRLRFYGVALADPASPAAQTFASEAVNWVIGDDESGVVKGRMKFCRPLFRSIYKVNKDLAVEKFLKTKRAFHPIARRMIAKDLKLE